MATHADNSESFSAEESTPWDGSTQSLKVIIIGAGIAGLSAAVGLRRAGHDVEVWRALFRSLSHCLLFQSESDLRTVFFRK